MLPLWLAREPLRDLSVQVIVVSPFLFFFLSCFCCLSAHILYSYPITIPHPPTIMLRRSHIVIMLSPLLIAKLPAPPPGRV
ncbi:hypothetical protein BDZ94DRAFT_1271648 [Collybia nuda]|uniref:Uncharacterized protein n=1 Tax=Collybia nuda TaxID=64659 RepID=A0A9P6CEH4_9AGAR|nr:hypothetical protein BDZ94DRAFT_1271648 [Collybia nuda]